MITPLERIAAEAVQVEPGAAGDQHAALAVKFVVDALEKIPPPPVLVELVEDPQLGVGQVAPKDAGPMSGNVPVQLPGWIRLEVSRQSGLADLAGSAQEHHLLGKIGRDLAVEVARHVAMLPRRGPERRRSISR